MTAVRHCAGVFGTAVRNRILWPHNRTFMPHVYTQVAVNARAGQANEDTEADACPSWVLLKAVSTGFITFLLCNFLDDRQVLLVLGRGEGGINGGIHAACLVVRLRRHFAPHKLLWLSTQARTGRYYRYCCLLSLLSAGFPPRNIRDARGQQQRAP